MYITREVNPGNRRSGEILFLILRKQFKLSGRNVKTFDFESRDTRNYLCPNKE